MVSGDTQIKVFERESGDGRGCFESPKSMAQSQEHALSELVPFDAHDVFPERKWHWTISRVQFCGSHAHEPPRRVSNINSGSCH